MQGHAFFEWEKIDLHPLYDSVLVWSVVEFRNALRHMEHFGATCTTEYVEHIRRGLRVMESELSRRGIVIKSDSAEAPPSRDLVGSRGSIPPADGERGANGQDPHPSLQHPAPGAALPKDDGAH